MVVTVVRIRKVRMRMCQRNVLVTVRMACSRLDRWIMLVIMVWVPVVDMFMRMFERLVHVFVMMPFAQVQPDAKAHEYSGTNQRDGDGLPKCQSE
jgi:hypothetical protein